MSFELIRSEDKVQQNQFLVTWKVYFACDACGAAEVFLPKSLRVGGLNGRGLIYVTVSRPIFYEGGGEYAEVRCAKCAEDEMYEGRRMVWSQELDQKDNVRRKLLSIKHTKVHALRWEPLEDFCTCWQRV